MKNKNIIKSFDAIIPTKEQKKLMLENILKKKTLPLPFYKILAPLTFILIIIANQNVNVEQPQPALMTLKTPKIEFTYKNKCYIEANINIGKNLKKIGKTTIIENKNLSNIDIYKDEYNTIILKLNDYYLPFVETDCLKTKKG